MWFLIIIIFGQAVDHLEFASEAACKSVITTLTKLSFTELIETRKPDIMICVPKAEKEPTK